MNLIRAFFGALALALASVSMGIEVGRDTSVMPMPPRAGWIVLICGILLILASAARKDRP